MRVISFLRLLALARIAQASIKSPHAIERPLELIVIRDRDETCSVVTLRRTQRLRGLLPEQVYTQRLPSNNGQERVSFVAEREELLWSAASQECGQAFQERCRTGKIDAGALRQEVMMAGHETSPCFELTPTSPPSLSIKPLIQSGDSSNRVDLVFFSDGYLAEEESKFFDDALRLAQDVSQNHTFNTVQPLLNFWAAFTPSNESGVGAGGKPKDTPFGLYRDGTELRGVYYSKPEVARAACLSLGDQCDYPILMGNDPLYGGLGGEFTVITPSLANGPLVLRHELGHSVIDVGEEYDGGYGYFGVNAAQNMSQPVSWAHWLGSSTANYTETSTAAPAARSERAMMPLQDYAWTLLNTTTSWTANFSASGTYSRHLVRFSLSGMPESSDLTVELDGEDLKWAPRQYIGVDRWHYDVHRNGGLSDGIHEVKFTLNNADREGVAQLCSVEILEFGSEGEFNATPGHYSMYPTFSLNNATTFRPTNEDCLMRQVTTPNFCSVCIEGLWMSLLRHVDLIDAVDTASAEGKLVANLRLVPLAGLRPAAVEPRESYAVYWTKDGAILTEFTNKTRLEIDVADKDALYAVDVHYTTDEIRVDSDDLTRSHREVTFAGARTD